MNLQVAIIAFVVSYLGSVPPGTINVTSMQLSVRQQSRAAFFFALAASLTEFVYAGVTVRFQLYLSEKPIFTTYFQLITAIAMLLLGLINLLTKKSKKSVLDRKLRLKGRSGFKRGVVLGVLNPLTIPFWLTVTAYLQSNDWILLNGSGFWFYLMGISTGTFCLLLTVNKLGTRFARIADNAFLVYRIPGIIFIALGIYNVVIWSIS